MRNTDSTYIDVVDATLGGHASHSRTGIDTVSAPFQMSKYNLTGCAVPLLTTKKIFTKSLLVELQWYLSGQSNTQYLRDNGVKIWDLWADDDGGLGPVYGVQWRNCPDTRVITTDAIADHINKGYDVVMENGDKAVVHRNIDQLQKMVTALRDDPDSRRILLSAWNVAQLDDMNLPPCHMVWQLCSKVLTLHERIELAAEIGQSHKEAGIESRYTMVAGLLGYCNSDNVIEEVLSRYEIPTRGLYAGLYQRSVDVGIGMPFNIAGYGILSQFIAHITNHMPLNFTHFGGDVHIYNDHFDALVTQSKRDPVSCNPRVIIPQHWRELKDFDWQAITIFDYDHQPSLPMSVAK